jgi:hypothetical protein
MKSPLHILHLVDDPNDATFKFIQLAAPGCSALSFRACVDWRNSGNPLLQSKNWTTNEKSLIVC